MGAIRKVIICCATCSAANCGYGQIVVIMYYSQTIYCYVISIFFTLFKNLFQRQFCYNSARNAFSIYFFKVDLALKGRVRPLHQASLPHFKSLYDNSKKKKNSCIELKHHLKKGWDIQHCQYFSSKIVTSPTAVRKADGKVSICSNFFPIGAFLNYYYKAMLYPHSAFYCKVRFKVC